MECNNVHVDLPMKSLVGGQVTLDAALEVVVVVVVDASAAARRLLMRFNALESAETVSSHAGLSQSSDCFRMEFNGFRMLLLLSSFAMISGTIYMTAKYTDPLFSNSNN